MRWTAVALLALAACASTNGTSSGTANRVDTGSTPTVSGTPGTDATRTPPAAESTSESTGESTGESTVAPAGATTDAEESDAGSRGGTHAARPVGFGSTTATVTSADGTTCDLCLWLADTADQRARGLMSVTDLGPADGMAFRYPQPHTGSFWMKDTLLPLSIVFYAPDGEHLDSFDMEPCTTPTCLSYETPTDFLVAVEVPQGELDRLGLTPGSRLTLHGLPCT